MDEDNEFNNLLNNINDNNNMNNLNFLNDRANVRFIRKYHVRNRRNPFVEFDEAEFIRRFRISKAEVTHVYNLIDGPENLEPLVKYFSYDWNENAYNLCEMNSKNIG